MLFCAHYQPTSGCERKCVQKQEGVQKKQWTIQEQGVSGERAVSQQTVMSCFSKAAVVRAVCRGTRRGKAAWVTLFVESVTSARGFFGNAHLQSVLCCGGPHHPAPYKALSLCSFGKYYKKREKYSECFLEQQTLDSNSEINQYPSPFLILLLLKLQFGCLSSPRCLNLFSVILNSVTGSSLQLYRIYSVNLGTYWSHKYTKTKWCKALFKKWDLALVPFSPLLLYIWLMHSGV